MIIRYFEDILNNAQGTTMFDTRKGLIEQMNSNIEKFPNEKEFCVFWLNKNNPNNFVIEKQWFVRENFDKNCSACEEPKWFQLWKKNKV